MHSSRSSSSQCPIDAVTFTIQPFSFSSSSTVLTARTSNLSSSSLSSTSTLSPLLISPEHSLRPFRLYAVYVDSEESDECASTEQCDVILGRPTINDIIRTTCSSEKNADSGNSASNSNPEFRKTEMIWVRDESTNKSPSLRSECQYCAFPTPLTIRTEHSPSPTYTPSVAPMCTVNHSILTAKASFPLIESADCDDIKQQWNVKHGTNVEQVTNHNNNITYNNSVIYNNDNIDKNNNITHPANNNKYDQATNANISFKKNVINDNNDENKNNISGNNNNNVPHKLCKQFSLTGKCTYGARCLFYHSHENSHTSESKHTRPRYKSNTEANVHERLHQGFASNDTTNLHQSFTQPPTMPVLCSPIEDSTNSRKMFQNNHDTISNYSRNIYKNDVKTNTDNYSSTHVNDTKNFYHDNSNCMNMYNNDVHVKNNANYNDRFAISSNATLQPCRINNYSQKNNNNNYRECKGYENIDNRYYKSSRSSIQYMYNEPKSVWQNVESGANIINNQVPKVNNELASAQLNALEKKSTVQCTQNAIYNISTRNISDKLNTYTAIQPTLFANRTNVSKANDDKNNNDNNCHNRSNYCYTLPPMQTTFHLRNLPHSLPQK